MDIKLEGLKELTAQLKGIANNLAADMSPSVAKAASDAAEEARRRAPVRTGELRESIGYDVRATADGAKGEVYADAPHAAAVENGTSRREATPFLYPAVADEEGAITQKLSNGLGEAIRTELMKRR